MADSEEYELLPHSKLEQLRSELESLRRNPSSNAFSDKELVNAIDRFAKSVDRLYGLFENVQKEILDEYQKGEKPEDKLDKVIEQNKHIAEGIISIAGSINREPSPQKDKTIERRQSTFVPPQKDDRAQITDENMLPGETHSYREQRPQQHPQQGTSGGEPQPMSFEPPQPRPEQHQTNIPSPPSSQQQYTAPPDPFRQQREMPPVRANYPSPRDYPSLPEEPKLVRPVHAEPGRAKKKFAGLF